MRFTYLNPKSTEENRSYNKTNVQVHSTESLNDPLMMLQGPTLLNCSQSVSSFDILQLKIFKN